MIRRHENSVSFKAGVLAIGVHAALLIALLVSVNWKTTHTASVAEVELWDSLPSPQVQKPIPRPEPKVESPPKPEPPKVEKVEPPEPKIEPKSDITVKKLEKIEKKIEKPKEKKPDALAALQKQLMQDELEKDKRQKKDDALKKLQQEALADEKADSDQQVKASKSAASQGEVDKYKTQIQRKIQQRVIKTLCGDGNPKLVFNVVLITVTGELQGNPKLIQSSKIAACDEAVERAIIQSAPFALPSDINLREQFRNLTLEFIPNN